MQIGGEGRMVGGWLGRGRGSRGAGLCTAPAPAPAPAPRTAPAPRLLGPRDLSRSLPIGRRRPVKRPKLVRWQRRGGAGARDAPPLGWWRLLRFLCWRSRRRRARRLVCLRLLSALLHRRLLWRRREFAGPLACQAAWLWCDCVR